MMGESKKEKSLLFKIFQSATSKNRQEFLKTGEDELKDSEAAAVLQEMFESEPETVREEVPAEIAPEPEILADERIHTSEDLMDAADNYLEALRVGATLQQLKEFEASGEEHPAFFSDFTYGNILPDESKKVFLKELQQTAGTILERRRIQAEEEVESAWKTEEGQQEEAQNQQEESKELVKAEPVNGHVCIKIPDDRMSAWLFAFPPENGGKDITEELVLNALNECRIIHGKDETLIKQIVYQLIYLKLVEVAHGTEPVDGTDGYVTDHFSRAERSSFEGTEDIEGQSIDFKNLNWLHPINENEVICDIVVQVESQNGRLVTGETVKGRNVAKVVIPSGMNTVVNEEKTALLSKIDGTLYFEGGRFHVKDVLNIMSDVDLTVGNINTVGNVDIKGDVLSGFTVRATGDVSIRGMVGNSTIIAGGNIKINMGVRGCGEALIQCEGNLDCVYIENCTIRVHGKINASSIINSDVSSDDEITANKIVGGVISALTRITTKVIGNNQHRQAVFNLGITQETLHARTNLEQRAKELEGELAKVTKSLRFLLSKRRLADREAEALAQLQEQNENLKKETEEVSQSLAEVQGKINEFSECELQAQAIYPPVTVTLRSDAVIIENEMSMCRFWSEDGVLKMR